MSVALVGELIVPRDRPVTAEDFEKFDPESRYDLIEGEPLPMPPMPGEQHGAITSDTAFVLTAFVKTNGLGQCYAAETRFVVQRNPDTVLAPDWAFIRKERLTLKRSRGFVQLVPDAVLEVRSPSDTLKAVTEKMQRWMGAGVRLGWELDPDAQVMTVYRPGQPNVTLGIEDTLSGEDVLPGFTLPLRLLFDEL